MLRRSQSAVRSTVPGRWPGRRAVAQVGALCVVVGGVVTGTQAQVQAAPEKVLQSVVVGLGHDGSVTSIDSTTVRRSGGEDATSEKQTFQPAKAAADLPVRVQTAYRLGDKVGTDLSEIEGEKGTVVVDVTVQNTTVVPQQVSYTDDAGVEHSQVALVGTPLTVVASADLGAGGLARVVTPSGDGDGAATDGVLSRSEDGHALVQWAAMLAPPRLAPSVTFRLVEQTDDFAPPTLDLSVQPGLVTDPSVQSLLRSAFDDDGGTLELERATIRTISGVSQQISQAHALVQSIHESLAGSAKELGQRTYADLTSSAASVEAQLGQTRSDLAALQKKTTTSLSGASDELSRNLDALLTQVDQQVLGDPSAAPPAAAKPVEGCTIGLPSYSVKPGQQLTLAQTVLQVKAQLQALSAQSGTCQATMAQALGAAMDGAKASVDQAKVGLGHAATDIAETLRRLTTAFDGDAVGQLQAALPQITAKLETLLDASDAAVAGVGSIGHGSQGLAGLTGLVSSISTAADALAGTLGAAADSDTVFGKVGEIAATAEDRRTALDGLLDVRPPADDTTSVVAPLTGELAALLDARCGSGSGDALRGQRDLDGVRRALDDVDAGCELGALAGQVGGLLDALQQEQRAWDGVRQDADDVAQLKASLDRALATTREKLGDITSVVDALLASVSGGSAGTGLAEMVQQIRDDVLGLYDGGDAATWDCKGSRPPLTGRPVNVALAAAARLQCLEQSYGATVDQTIDSLDDTFGSASDDTLQGVNAQLDSALEVARRKSGEFTGAFSSALDTTVNGAVAKDIQRISNVKLQLRQQVGGIDRRFDGRVRAAITQLAGLVTSADKDVEGSRAALDADFEAVFTDLGDPTAADNNGLLGSLRENAAETGSSAGQLGRANDAAVAFGNLRSTGVQAVRLQQAQLEAALDKQAEFPGFGIPAPSEDGSVLTVFSFHLGK